MQKTLISFLLLLSLGPLYQCSAALSPARQISTYPEEWWKKIPKKEAKWWEILPQEARTGEVILSKRTALGILSNFAATPFELDGKRYASIEGFWQMMKYPDPADPLDPRILPGRRRVATARSCRSRSAASRAIHRQG